MEMFSFSVFSKSRGDYRRHHPLILGACCFFYYTHCFRLCRSCYPEHATELQQLQRTLHLIFFQYDILLAYQAFQILGSQHYLKRTITTTTDTPFYSFLFFSFFSSSTPSGFTSFPSPSSVREVAGSPLPPPPSPQTSPPLPSPLSLFSPFHLSFFPFQIPSFCCRSSFCQLSRSYRFAANLSPSLSLWS